MAIHLKGTQASVYLDLIRGLAAIEVLLFHAWGQLFLPIEESGRQPLFARILRQIVSYGHEGVVVFFVLSGLLISASVIQDVRSGRWSWQRYAVARASRMYMVLVPALLLTFALHQAGIALFAGRFDTSDPGNDSVNLVIIGQRLVAPVFLGNLCFLQAIFVDVFGSNFALWSLANEWWYYVIFPCFWLSFSGCSGWRGWLALWTAGTALLFLVGGKNRIVFHGLASGDRSVPGAWGSPGRQLPAVERQRPLGACPGAGCPRGR